MTEWTLKLRKCAYLFDRSADRFLIGSRSYIDQIRAERAQLFKYYDSAEMRAVPLEYWRDARGNIYIELNGNAHPLYDLAIAEIAEPDNVINHRRDISLAIFTGLKNFYTSWNTLHSRRFCTLYFDFFTGADELGYIRAHFKNNTAQFVIDDRTGELYTAGDYGRHKLISREHIRKLLEIKGEAAAHEFNIIMNTIQYKGVAK